MEEGERMIAEGYPQQEELQRYIDLLAEKWKDLLAAMDERKRQLDLSEQARRFLADAGEDEAWMKEQLQAIVQMSDQRVKDEQSVQNLLKKHANLARRVDDYGDSKLKDLNGRAQDMVDQDHPNKYSHSKREKLQIHPQFPAYFHLLFAEFLLI